MNLFTPNRSTRGPLLLAFLSAVAVQVPLFGLLDAYPLVYDFGHSNLRKMYTLESLLVFNLIDLLISAGLFIAVVGLPLFALLRFFRFERMWTSALVGLVVATAHYAYVRWPTYEFLKGFPYECSYWLGGEISYTQDGALTGYAWADYFIELVRQGLHGLVAGLVFYRVWRVRSAPVVGPVGT